MTNFRIIQILHCYFLSQTVLLMCIHDCMTTSWSWRIKTLVLWGMISRFGSIDVLNFVCIPFLNTWVWIKFYDVHPFFPYANLCIQSFLPKPISYIHDSVLIWFIWLNTCSSFALVNVVISNRVVLVKKAQARIWKFFYQLSNLSQPVFLLENPTHWGFETVVCPILVKPVLHFFVVCSVVPCMNLSHRQQSYLCPKNQNNLLEKADLRFFLIYVLRTTIKITIFSTFYVTNNFSSCYCQEFMQKIQTLSIKLSSK